MYSMKATARLGLTIVFLSFGIARHVIVQVRFRLAAVIVCCSMIVITGMCSQIVCFYFVSFSLSPSLCFPFRTLQAACCKGPSPIAQWASGWILGHEGKRIGKPHVFGTSPIPAKKNPRPRAAELYGARTPQPSSEASCNAVQMKPCSPVFACLSLGS